MRFCALFTHFFLIFIQFSSNFSLVGGGGDVKKTFFGPGRPLRPFLAIYSINIENIHRKMFNSAFSKNCQQLDHQELDRQQLDRRLCDSSLYDINMEKCLIAHFRKIVNSWTVRSWTVNSWTVDCVTSTLDCWQIRDATSFMILNLNVEKNTCSC